MRRHLRLPSIATLLALLLLAASSTPAGAKTKRFRPRDFVPRDSSVNAVRTPVAIGAWSTIAEFAVPLGLPVGATLTGIRFYTNGAAAPRSVDVVRYAMPGIAEGIGGAASTAAVPSTVTPELRTGGLTSDLAARVIDRDHLYFVSVTCYPGTAVWAVEVDYAP